MDRRLVAPRAVRYGLSVVYAGVVLSTSVVPVPDGPVPPTGPFGVPGDKLLHAGTYALLALLLAYAALPRSARRLAMVAAVAAGYGVGIELLQALLPYRSFEVADALANVLGALLAVGLWWIASRYAGAVGPSDRGS